MVIASSENQDNPVNPKKVSMAVMFRMVAEVNHPLYRLSPPLRKTHSQPLTYVLVDITIMVRADASIARMAKEETT